MIKQNNNTLFAGIIAGLASVVMVYCSQFTLFFPLNLLVIVPIFLIAFAYGTYASFAATITATIAMALFTPTALRIIAPNFHHPFYITFIFLIFYFVPASLFSWFYTAQKPANITPNHIQQNHYSLGDIFNYIALYLSIITTVFCLIVSNDTNILTDPLIMQLSAQVSQSLRDASYTITNSDPELGAALTSFNGLETYIILIVISAIIASTSFFAILTGLYTGLRVAGYKHWLSRQSPIWPRDLRLPMSTVILFGVSFCLSNIPLNPYLTTASAIFFVVLFIAFMCSGLAFIHYKTKNFTYRLPLLVGVYLCLFSMFLTPFAAFGITICGIVATFYKNKTPIQKH